jgi:hypothetical protein
MEATVEAFLAAASIVLVFLRAGFAAIQDDIAVANCP